jgi:acetyl-CoA synthetase
MQVTQQTDAAIQRHAGYEADPQKQDALWAELRRDVFSVQDVPFTEQWRLYQRIFATRTPEAGPPKAWTPTAATIDASNIEAAIDRAGASTYADLHLWSVQHRGDFWKDAIDHLGIPFSAQPKAVLAAAAADVKAPGWLSGARLNIADACFQAPPGKVAIRHASEDDATVREVTYEQLERLADRFAAGIRAHGLGQGDAVALYMPMTVECVAAYVGVVRAGGTVVSIPDSFAPPEVATRLRIGKAKMVLTVDAFRRAGKMVPLYPKVCQAEAPRTIVIADGDVDGLRDGDILWDDFLAEPDGTPSSHGPPDRVTNILFSSGTTGEPKGIPWTQLTPIKAAVDGHYHQDIHPDDVVAWPTNIGWMMGPWLIYATFVNRATMALYDGVPTTKGFVAFVKDAGVTVLGLVPSVVRAWRENRAVARDALAGVRVFSSTGEASNTYDYLWLMSRSGYRAPVIEYCGGTEIGGGHITGTVVQPACPATFSTPALGIDFVVLDGDGTEAREGCMGEIFLVPPSIGLSERLLNKDHEEVYYEGCPAGPEGQVLRRHGDQVLRLHKGYYQALGRADDTMNLGGIKVSSIELERVMDAHPAVFESAAVAVTPPGGGADRLVAFLVLQKKDADLAALKKELQARLKDELNPLFRLVDVVAVDELPRTASNKVMRRTLRDGYDAG